MRSDLIKNKRNILIVAVTISLFGCMQSANAENIHSYSNLQKAIQSATTSVINLENNIAATSQTGELGALGSALLNLYGNGYDINGNGQTGIIIGSGQTLNINNVGTEGSKGFSGFVTQDVGGAIYSEGGNINVSNSIFSDNQSLLNYSGGGAIYAQDTNLNIKDSTFIGNSTINKDIASGGALLINQYSTTNIGSTTISNSDFIDNSAMRGGAIYNSTAEVTIKDTIFTGNTATEDGGAIYNQGGTLNIVAEDSDTVFTGNSANGESNAIYNNGSTTNLNAKGGKIIFNDGISGSTSNSININNDSDAGGVVEFNSSVKNNNIYLYDGTLKLGSHTYTQEENSFLAGQTVYGSLEGSNFTVKAGGTPTVDLIDNAVRETNLGNISLETDLQLAIDADLQAKTADKITGSVGTANNNNIIISDVNILTDTNQPSTTVIVADENLKDLVMLSDYAEITKPADVKNNYMLAYDNTDGSLTFNQELTLASVIAQTASDRIYNMAMDEEAKYGLGIMGGDGSRLTVNAGGYDINGNGYSGVTVNQG